MCFNPRARDERECVLWPCFNLIDVSIHALVMSANFKAWSGVVVLNVSIHALVMSAKISDPLKTTYELVSIHALVMSANFFVLRNLICVSQVSIHALVMSAKISFLPRYRDHVCFNPRARDERESMYGAMIGNAVGFNPRARDEREK